MEPFEPGANRGYLRAIEEAYAALRGTGFFLSPADRELALRWEREGVPLTLVLRTLAEEIHQLRGAGAGIRLPGLRWFNARIEEELRRARARLPAQPPASEERPELAVAEPVSPYRPLSPSERLARLDRSQRRALGLKLREEVGRRPALVTPAGHRATLRSRLARLLGPPLR